MTEHEQTDQDAEQGAEQAEAATPLCNWYTCETCRHGEYCACAGRGRWCGNYRDRRNE